MRKELMNWLLTICLAFLVLIITYFLFPKLVEEKPRRIYSVSPAKSAVYKEKESEILKLPSIYRIAYGDINAPIKIVEFFSFQCPHCIRLFKTDFARIKSDLIDTGKVYFEFHPVPEDLTTAQALICFEKLTEQQKRLFLEVILEEAVPSNPELMAKLMITAMNVFKSPIIELDNPDYLKSHPIFENVYVFVSQQKIEAVPTVEINGHFLPKEIPNYEFISSLTKN